MSFLASVSPAPVRFSSFTDAGAFIPAARTDTRRILPAKAAFPTRSRPCTTQSAKRIDPLASFKYNISHKVQIVVEHFRGNAVPLLDGQAKAMFVLGSRIEAVRWQLAIDRYIKAQGYRMATMVAFSGEVNDPESNAETFTETSARLNRVLNLLLCGQDACDRASPAQIKKRLQPLLHTISRQSTRLRYS